jgi:hypothetical protein
MGTMSGEAAEHLQQPRAAAPGRAEDPDETGLERDARPDASACQTQRDVSARAGGVRELAPDSACGHGAASCHAGSRFYHLSDMVHSIHDIAQ